MRISLFVLIGFGLCCVGCMDKQTPTHTNPIAFITSVKVQTLKPQALSILERSFKSPDAYLRANAIEVTVTTKQKQFLPQLAKMTTDQAPAVRFAATVALGDLHCTGFESLLRNLLNDPDTNVQIAAAYSLTKLNQKQYAQLLHEAVVHSGPSVRANAALLLGKLGDRDDIPLLYRILRDDSSTAMVRMQAVESIARLGDQQIYRTKLWALLISKFNDDRVMGIRGMGALGTTEAIDAIKTMLNDDVYEVKLAAAHELARLGQKNGLQLVRDHFKQPGNMNNSDMDNCIAIMAVGYMKDSELNNSLPKALSSTSRQVQLLGSQSVLLQCPSQ